MSFERRILCCQRSKGYWTFVPGRGDIRWHQSHCPLVGMPTSITSAPGELLLWQPCGVLGGLLPAQDRGLGTCCLLPESQKSDTPGCVCVCVLEGREGHRALTSLRTASGIVGTRVFGDSVLVFLHQAYGIENNIFCRGNIQNIISQVFHFQLKCPVHSQRGPVHKASVAGASR